MVSEPIKHFALGLVCCKVADQSAFSGVFPELLDLCQIVLHGRPPGKLVFLNFNPVTHGVYATNARRKENQPAGVDRRAFMIEATTRLPSG